MKAGVISVIDQALLSVVNLGISIAVIKFSTKEEYGIYVMLMAPILLAQGILNALILSPLISIYATKPQDRQSSIIGTAYGLNELLMVALAAIGAVGLYTYLQYFSAGPSNYLEIGFSVAIAGVCGRECNRFVKFAKMDPKGALMLNIWFALLLALFITIAITANYLTAGTALLATGLAALGPYVYTAKSLPNKSINPEILQEFWTRGRWAIVGVIVAWINLSAYPIIVGINLDHEAVADINVARLFLVPAALGITAWANINRIKIAKWISDADYEKVRRLTGFSIFGGLIALLFGTALLLALFPVISQLLGSEYQGIAPLIVLWSIYFAISLPRNFLMATLMTTPTGYKHLQTIGWIALVISMLGLPLLGSNGTLWVVSTLIAVEAFQLAAIYIKTRKWWQGDLT